jgi:hypothetical protein
MKLPLNGTRQFETQPAEPLDLLQAALGFRADV